MKKILPIIALATIFSCGSSYGMAAVPRTPASFSRTQSQSWSSIEVRDGVEYERAWNTVFEILSKDFEIDAAMREEGYIRTGWLHTWSGLYQSNYRVRVTIKFSPDRAKLQFLSEAQALVGRNWILGTDSRLVSTLKTDLMGTMGRTTR